MGNDEGAAFSLNNLAVQAHEQSKYGLAERFLQQTLQLTQDPRLTIVALSNQGELALSRGDYLRATELHERALQANATVQDEWLTLLSLYNLGVVLIYRKEFVLAGRRLREGLRRAQALGDVSLVTELLHGLASVNARTGRPTVAARLLGCVAALRTSIGAPLQVRDLALHKGAAEQARRELGHTAFAAEWATGHAWDLDHAVAACVGAEPRSGTCGSGTSFISPAWPPACCCVIIMLIRDNSSPPSKALIRTVLVPHPRLTERAKPIGDGGRGPKELTGMVDLTRDAHGRVRARLLDLVPGRSGKAYADWLDLRGERFRSSVKVATLDPFHGYKNAIDDQLADAVAVLDAFHVVKLGTDAMDQCRRRVQQDTLGHRGRKNDPLYGIRNTLRAGRERLTDRQRARLVKAFTSREEHLQVEVAWSCAQRLRAAYQHPDPAQGKKIAEQILASFPTCPVPEIARLGRTLKQWQPAFLAYFTTGRSSNGGTEAINGLIELHRRVARGFRNRDKYRLRMLLIGGGLTSPHLK